VALVRRRGLRRVDLGITTVANVGLSQGIRIAAWALLAVIGGALVTVRLATGGASGFSSTPGLVVALFHAAEAGFIEEIVVLAFVVVTLEQARRPRPEIVAVALLLRVSFHIYYGPGALGILVWASAFLWLFLRFRTIIPLIVVHSGWDIAVTLVYRWPGLTTDADIAVVALFLVSISLWLKSQVTPDSRSVPSAAPIE